MGDIILSVCKNKTWGRIVCTTSAQLFSNKMKITQFQDVLIFQHRLLFWKHSDNDLVKGLAE